MSFLFFFILNDIILKWSSLTRKAKSLSWIGIETKLFAFTLKEILLTKVRIHLYGENRRTDATLLQWVGNKSKREKPLKSKLARKGLRLNCSRHITSAMHMVPIRSKWVNENISKQYKDHSIIMNIVKVLIKFILNVTCM